MRIVRVIPILVDGAQMPRTRELPPTLAALVRRQALELSPNQFTFDTNRLFKVLDKTLAEVRTAQKNTSSISTSDANPDGACKLAPQRIPVIAKTLPQLSSSPSFQDLSRRPATGQVRIRRSSAGVPPQRHGALLGWPSVSP